MSHEDRIYFLQRAEVETERAERSMLPEVVSAHYRLATAYLERATLESSPDQARNG